LPNFRPDTSTQDNIEGNTRTIYTSFYYDTVPITLNFDTSS